MMKLFFLVAAAGLSLDQAVLETPSNWTVNLRVDAMTDQGEGSAFLLDSQGGRLSVACNGLEEKTLSVQYLPGPFLGSRNNLVMFRFDSDPSYPAMLWTYVYKGAYTTDEGIVDAFSKSVGSGTRTIKLRALNYEDQPIDRAYQSVNGSTAINKVRAACGKSAI